MKRRLVRFAAVLSLILTAAAAPAPVAPAVASSPRVDAVVIAQPPALSPAVIAWRAALTEQRPPLHGFRAPILDQAAAPWPFERPGEKAEPQLRAAAEYIAQRMAFDGLLTTAAVALDQLGPLRIKSSEPDAAARNLQLLRTAGLPVDLLSYFHPPSADASAPPHDGLLAISHIMHRLDEKTALPALDAELRKWVFRFRPSKPGFAAAGESGEHAIGHVRVQLSSGSYWRGPYDGSNFDLFRQLVIVLLGTDFTVSIQQQHLEQFMLETDKWKLAKPGRITVLPEPRQIAQWAADNAKAGIITDPSNGSRTTASILPRYASRREDGSVFVPGETFLMDAFAARGHTCFQSPLLFQGGNVLIVTRPDGRHLLLLGEAEIYRNTVLGLTREQVIDAFGIEMGVDQVLVIPAVSFHLDFDVTVRTSGDRMIAFINDTPAAVKMILGVGIAAMQKHGHMTTEAAKTAQDHIDHDRFKETMEILEPVMRATLDPAGRFKTSFARAFAAHETDSGEANLRIFVLAMDFLTSWTTDPATISAQASQLVPAYLGSFARQRQDRMELRGILQQNGFEIVAVPSLAEGNRSLNYLNGVHDRTRYLMPAWGGLYQPLDDHARAVFQAALGPNVMVLPILTGESQRRFGAVHCSISVLPKIEP